MINAPVAVERSIKNVVWVHQMKRWIILFLIFQGIKEFDIDWIKITL